MAESEESDDMGSQDEEEVEDDDDEEENDHDDDDDDSSSSSDSEAHSSAQKSKDSKPVTLQSFFKSGGGTPLQSQGSLLGAEEIEEAISLKRQKPLEGYRPESWPSKMLTGNVSPIVKMGILMYHQTEGYCWFCCCTRACIANKVRE